ncbi:MAG: TIGR03013 family PEP-CTERM/XrtA system glycosyltransferase [Nitrospira sp.]|nr:TIGR03013 family PEP-CTERM/XrtA system glycosyltransferase [bacterium]MBL7048831.1 TIGR03013 family PEP-CTERM/XrtA system glycosyltransferase [Nitrospira sp.]
MSFYSPRIILLVLGDAVVAFLSVYAGIYLRLGNDYYLLFDTISPIYPKAIAFSVLTVFMCFFVDLYLFEKKDSHKEIFLKIVLSGGFAGVILAAVYYFAPFLSLGRGVFSIAIGLTILLQSAWHIGFTYILNLSVTSTRVLILGTGSLADQMGKLLYGDNGFSLVGYINCIGEPVRVPQDMVLGNGDSILPIALREKVQKVVVSLTERRGTFPVREVLNCKLQGIDIVDGPSFYEKMTGKLLIENMNPSHLIFSEGFRITTVGRHFKRIFDITIALIGIVIASPLILIVPILILFDSKGPILFKQKRVGEGGKVFTVYKFRTMVADAEDKSGPVWSSSGDRRITRLGRMLRKTRIDEIPQLFNVIYGNMSLIGPRPERAFFVESLSKQIPYYAERHCVKPGVTGWAQVRYEYGDSLEDAIEKLRYDLYYIKYQSLSLDLLIVLDTIKDILSGRGGR